MRVLKTPAEARAARTGPGSLGLVPTMGCLHEGHLSLVRAARAECDRVAVSIFVNPLQFAPGGDFDRYPRTLAADLDRLAGEGVDLVFAPAPDAVYPPGFDARVHVGGVSEGLEGGARPGHFDGVATVVAKLFNLLGPERAYFGQKDAQQVAVIRKMVRDLDVPVEVRVGATVRAADGLALSSRNAYLDAEARRAAVALPRALEAALRLAQGGERRATALLAAVETPLRAAPGVELEYAALSDPETLQALETVGAPGAVLSLAARVGGARLIDNVLLGPFAAPHPDQPFPLS